MLAYLKSLILTKFNNVNGIFTFKCIKYILLVVKTNQPKYSAISVQLKHFIARFFKYLSFFNPGFIVSITLLRKFIDKMFEL